MKKVALSLMALALIGYSAVAEDVMTGTTVSPVVASVEGNAHADFGIDLDTKVHGFTNGAEAKVKLIILNGVNSKTGAGDVGGFIEFKDIKVALGGSTDAQASGANVALSIGDITAKIVAGDLYIKLYGNSDAAVDYSLDGDDDSDVVLGGPEKFSAKYGATAAEWTLGSTTAVSVQSGKGIEVGYTIPSTLKIVGVIDSRANWEAATQSEYEGSVAVNLLSVEKLTLGGKFYTGAQGSDLTQGVGAEFAYDLGVAAPFAHVNYNLTDAIYDADFGSKLPLVDGLKIVAVGQYDSDSVFNAMVTLDLAEGKLAGPLSSLAGVRLLDVTKAVAAEAVTEIFVKVGFKASDVVAVWAKVDTYNSASSTDSSLFAKAGLDFTGISLTTISVNYNSSDLGAAKAQGDNKMGSLALVAKVAY